MHADPIAEPREPCGLPRAEHRAREHVVEATAGEQLADRRGLQSSLGRERDVRAPGVLLRDGPLAPPVAPGAPFEIARRPFDTPEFRGMEFIEAECKTIINHVPGNYLPFNWSINPYRGCSHACTYCVSPETPVLMA